MKQLPAGGLLGTLLVAAGAVLLASKGLFAKSLYAQGLNHNDVAAIRSVLAVPGFWVVALVLHGNPKSLSRAHAHSHAHIQKHCLPPADVLGAMLAGLLCYYCGALANFYALSLIQASVERALLFSYPAMVIVFHALWTRERPATSTLVSVALTSFGVLLVTGAADQSLTQQQLIGVGWVLFCSFTIAIYFMMSASLTQRLGSGNFTAVAMTTAGVAFLLHYQLQGPTRWLSIPPDAIAQMLGLVLFATILPLVCVAEGVRRIGAARGAIMSTLGPPATAGMAFFLLGERLSCAQLSGMVIIVASITFLELRQRR
jgi:drug/metabolite transporter (DMT)-like permease